MNTTKLFLMVLSIIILSLFVFLMITNALLSHTCDKKHGVDSWELMEVTGKGRFEGYVGQVWECVPKDTNNE